MQLARHATALLVPALIAAACAGPQRAATVAAPAAEALPFIEDDYPKALAEAKARHVPLFVDSWAPW